LAKNKMGENPMSSREKNQSDVDVETLIDIFDTALSSDNPAVKKALKNLMLVAALVDSELPSGERLRGPLRQAFEDMRDLTRRMDRLESQRTTWQNPVVTPGYSTGPVWTTSGTDYITSTMPTMDTITITSGAQDTVNMGSLGLEIPNLFENNTTK
jgi:hypothetical protein